MTTSSTDTSEASCTRRLAYPAIENWFSFSVACCVELMREPGCTNIAVNLFPPTQHRWLTYMAVAEYWCGWELPTPVEQTWCKWNVCLRPRASVMKSHSRTVFPLWWQCIDVGGNLPYDRTNLVQVTGLFTTRRFCDEITQSHIVPSTSHADVIFPHDNAEAWTARVTLMSVRNNNVLQCHSKLYYPEPQQLQQFALSLQAEWVNIPQSVIRALISSVGRRCQAVYEINGGLKVQEVLGSHDLDLRIFCVVIILDECRFLSCL